MSTPLVRLALAGLLALAATGCRPASDATPDVRLAWRVLPSPPRMGPATLSFTLTDRATGQPVAGADTRVEANMSHPGMQPVLASGTETGPGRYEATFDFTMSGDWFLLVDATLPDGRVLHRQIDVPGVRAGD